MSSEIISVAQMRAIDAAVAASTSTRTLMEKAGLAVAEAIMARWSPRPTAVLCGPGANGGDGFVAARYLRENGWPVWVETLGDVGALRGDAADAAGAWTGDTYGVGVDNPMAELFVDALFGAGISRPLEGESARLARALPADRVVAIDLPSGLDGDTGRPVGECTFRAALTVTFVRKKPAHVLTPGRALCGEIVVSNIGVSDDVVVLQGSALFENGPKLWGARFPWPAIDAHKHSRGHVMVMSGERLHTGAARLAARGALRAGAGLVTVVSPVKAAAENAAHLTAIMLDIAETPRHFSDAALIADCIVIGPAFGVEARHSERMHAARTTPKRCPIVFDADAISLLAPLKVKLGARDVVTPHLGEFKRAFPGLWDQSGTRVDAARTAAVRAGCTVLLKGPDTVIAAPDGRALVNTVGTPFLATAGAGDVLAGIIAGLIAQGMESFDAAAAAAWLHGRAGAAFDAGLCAEDIPDLLPSVLKGLRSKTGLAECNGA